MFTQVAALAVAASGQMSFLEHLEELRRRLIWCVIAVAVAFAACWAFAGDLYAIASAPLRANPEAVLSVSRPQDVFSLHVKVTLVGALFLAAPVLLAQAWLFISPALHRHERRYAIPVVVSGSVLFLAGGAFGYVVAFPAALRFLIDWTLELQLVPLIDAGEYFNLFFQVIVALGFVFQIPVVSFLLSRIGLVDARFLLRHVKLALFGCVVVAAVITPTPDFANMLILAGPMFALYCVGIVVAWAFGRKREE